MAKLVVAVIHNIYYWTPTLKIKPTMERINYGAEYKANTFMVMDVMMLIYHVQFVMSVIVLQSTWFPLSIATCQTPESILISKAWHEIFHKLSCTIVKLAQWWLSGQ